MRGSPATRNRGMAMLSLMVQLLPALTILGLTPARAQQSTIFVFENSAPGSPPAGFAAAKTGMGAPGRWELLVDPTAPSGTLVVGRLALDPSIPDAALLLAEKIEAVNLALGVRFKAVSGTGGKAAGLVARHRDDSNYYLLRADAIAGEVRLYHVLDGTRREIAGAPAVMTADAWHSLGLVIVGRAFRVSFDGATLFEAEDDAIREAGKIGLWTEADSVAYFDNLSIAPAN